LAYTVVAFAAVIHEGMVDAVKMYRVGKIMGIFDHQPDHVALFDTYRVVRHADERSSFYAGKAPRRHITAFRSEDPEAGLDSGGDIEGWDNAGKIRRVSIQLDDFEFDDDMVGVSVAIHVVRLGNRVRRQVGRVHDRLHGDVVGPLYESGDVS